jgi:hypothetical protein
MSTTQYNQGEIGDHHITPSPATPPMYTTEKNSATLSMNDKKDSSSSEKDLGLETTNSAMASDSEENVSRSRRLFNKYKIFVHLAIWLVMTGYAPALLSIFISQIENVFPMPFA